MTGRFRIWVTPAILGFGLAAASGCGGSSTSPRLSAPAGKASATPVPTPAPSSSPNSSASGAVVAGLAPVSLSLTTASGLKTELHLPAAVSGAGASIHVAVSDVQRTAASGGRNRLSAAPAAGPVLALAMSSTGPVSFATPPTITFAPSAGSLNGARLRIGAGMPPLLTGVTLTGTAGAGGLSFNLPSRIGTGSTSPMNARRRLPAAAGTGAVWALAGQLTIPPLLSPVTQTRNPLPEMYLADNTGGGFDGTITAFWNSGANSSTFSLGLPITNGVFAADAAADIFFLSSGVIYENTLLGNLKVATDSIMASGTVSALAVDPSGSYVAAVESTTPGVSERIAVFYKGKLTQIIPIANVAYDPDFSSFSQSYAYSLAFDSKANLYASTLGGDSAFEFTAPAYAYDAASVILNGSPVQLNSFGFALDSADKTYFATFNNPNGSLPGWIAMSGDSVLATTVSSYYDGNGVLDFQFGGVDRDGNVYVNVAGYEIDVYGIAGWPTLNLNLFGGNSTVTGSDPTMIAALKNESLILFDPIPQMATVPAAPKSAPAPPAGTPLPSGTLTPSPSMVLLTPSAPSQALSITETGYTGTFSEIDNCGTIATLSSTSSGFTVTAGTTFGLCTATIYDAFYFSTTASIEYIPSATGGGPAMITFAPSAVNLTATGQTSALTVSDGSYAGTFTLSSTSSTPCSSIATVVQSGANNQFTVTATGAGTCTQTFTDSGGNKAAVPISVAVTDIVGQGRARRRQ